MPHTEAEKLSKRFAIILPSLNFFLYKIAHYITAFPALIAYSDPL